jgi:nitrogen fixation protein NifU and related proteins
MNQESTNFWQRHSARFLEMALREDKRETLNTPDGYGKKTRECGDTIELFLTVRDGRIAHASFTTNGCVYSVACANAVLHMIEGKSLEEAWQITPEKVAEYLETLPPKEFHCAQLAVQALLLALANCRETARHPWRKFYQTYR